VLAFGRGAGADVRAEAVSSAAGVTFTLVTPAGAVGVRLALPGAHNVGNALAAAAAALALGVPLADVAAGLAQVRPVPGRLCLRPGWDAGVQVLDDTYNANPASLAAAVGVLAELPGTRVLALGDMGELGPEAAVLHAQAGAHARAAGLDALCALGPLAARAAQAFGAGGVCFDAPDALVAALRARAQRPLAVLVKGSRAARMERVVAGLLPEREH
jgi:UDP-N-acetylmuramoyl-tripeptide--D-alanyl-D-alanine ligase